MNKRAQALSAPPAGAEASFVRTAAEAATEPAAAPSLTAGTAVDAARARPAFSGDIPEFEKKALAYAKKGIVLALVSGIIFSADGLLVKSSAKYAPFNSPDMFLLVPLICAGIHDLCAALLTTLDNWHSGRLGEVRRSLPSKPGRYVLAGAFIGALCGMGGYMAALQLAGPAYVLPITTLYPAVAAILAVFMLKERIPPRAWAGLFLCVIGAAAIGYTPPSGQVGETFYLGLALAALAAVGWGAEGVCATFGMDFIEPMVALNMYYLVSTALYWLILIPCAGLILFPHESLPGLIGGFVSSKGALFVAVAGMMGTFSYRCWYMSMSMTGVSRAMALNISYALWGILLSALFSDAELTTHLIIGALIIFVGMFLVIGNPRDMLNLRNVH